MRDYDREKAPLLKALTALPIVAEAEIIPTGGGCYCLYVTLTDGRLAVGTDGSAGIPEGREKWYLNLFAEEDDWAENRQDPIMASDPLTAKALVALVATWHPNPVTPYGGPA